MAVSSPSSSSSSSVLDSLFFCEEQYHPWKLDDQNDDVEQYIPHLNLNQQDLLWEDEELVSLFTKEQLQTHPSTFSFDQTDPYVLVARKDAVDWILKVKSHFGFTHLTAILSINYLDRFLSSLHFQKDKPWMIQLLAVTCLSLAAKVDQTQVPPLLDLQVEDPKYLFEPKNIQKMELLVLSTLKWKMNPVTPISFLDHIVRRLGLKTHLHWDFYKKCEDLILSLVSDSRFVGYEPSVIATAAMVHVIEKVEVFNSVDYQNQLLGVLKTTKEKVNECYEMIMDAHSVNTRKRKLEEYDTRNHSPVSVMDATSSFSFSSSSHHQRPIKKMGIVQPQKLGFALLSCKAFVDVVSSPR